MFKAADRRLSLVSAVMAALTALMVVGAFVLPTNAKAVTVQVSGAQMQVVPASGETVQLVLRAGSETQNPGFTLFENFQGSALIAGAGCESRPPRSTDAAQTVICSNAGVSSGQAVLGGGPDRLEFKSFRSFAGFPPATDLIPFPWQIDLGAGDDNLNVDALPDPSDKSLRVIGGPGADIINGGGGPDLLLGGDGDDQIQGGDGADRIDFGTGRDFYRWTYDGAPDVVTSSPSASYRPAGGPFGISNCKKSPEVDTVRNVNPLDVVRKPATLTLTGGADDGPSGENDNITGFQVVEGTLTRLVGSSLAECTQIGSFGVLRIDAGGGDDDVRGGGMTTTRMFGDAGDDNIRVNGSTSDVVADGGAGADYILSQNRKERAKLRGGPGEDVLVGCVRASRLDGGAGRDIGLGRMPRVASIEQPFRCTTAAPTPALVAWSRKHRGSTSASGPRRP